MGRFSFLRQIGGTGDLGRLFKFLIGFVVVLVLLAVGAIAFWMWIWRDGFM